MRVRVTAVSLWALLLFAALTPTARATTMVRASVEELTRASSAVVLGRVTDTEAVQGPRGGIYTRVRLRVEGWWRGAPAGDEIVFFTHGGRIGDRAMRTHGAARFVRGERVVVFLYEATPGRLFVTGMSQGKWRVQGEVAQSAADASTFVDLRDQTAPPTSTSLADLRDRVRGVGR